VSSSFPPVELDYESARTTFKKCDQGWEFLNAHRPYLRIPGSPKNEEKKGVIEPRMPNVINTPPVAVERRKPRKLCILFDRTTLDASDPESSPTFFGSSIASRSDVYSFYCSGVAADRPRMAVLWPTCFRQRKGDFQAWSTTDIVQVGTCRPGSEDSKELH